MKKRIIIMSFTVSLTLGVTGYALYRGLPRTSGSAAPSSKQPAARQEVSPPQQQTKIVEPPPPPAPGDATASAPRPERSLTLIGVTTDQLRQIEQFLPDSGRIETYPVSEAEQRAAYATADLNGDGNIETVVVYKRAKPEVVGGDLPLFLGVLVPGGNGLILLSSVRLNGVLIYGNIYEKSETPFAVRNVTGSNHPEIIVSSGLGASLGGTLQIYFYDGSSLHQLADIDGHSFHVSNGGNGRVSEITAQSRYEDKPQVYRWNGQKFEQNATSGKR